MLIFWLHFVSLILSTDLLLRRSGIKSTSYRLLGNLVWSQSNVVLVAIFLSTFNKLNDNALFVFSSVFFQIIAFILLSKTQPHISKAPKTENIAFYSKFQSWTYQSSVLVFIFVAIAVLALALRLPLLTPDTSAMKLPNAFFYMRHGNLLPATELTNDSRLFATPYNGFLLWQYLIRWQQHPQLILLLSYMNWALMGLAIYEISRLIGASKRGATMAAFVFCSTICMIWQGVTDQDDLISSTATTIAALYGILWLRHGRWIDALILSLGVGYCFGAKAFPALYLWAILAFVTYYFIAWGPKKFFGWLALRWPQIAVMSAVFLALALPYAISNYFTYGALSYMSPQHTGPFQNKPFRIAVAIHNLAIYNIQLLFYGIPDILSFSAGRGREILVDNLNLIFEHFIPKVKGATAFDEKVQPFFKEVFEGGTWYGIIPLSVAIGWPLSSAKKNPRFKTIATWLLAFFIAWDLFFCSRQKFIAGMGRYWILPVSLLCPCIALLWDEAQGGAKKRVLRGIMVTLLVSTSYIACASFLKSGVLFNWLNLKTQFSRPYVFDSPQLSPDLNSILSEPTPLNYITAVYNFPYFSLWRRSHNSRFTEFHSIRNDSINILPVATLPLAHDGSYEKSIAIDMGPYLKNGFSRVAEDYAGYPIYAWAPSELSCSVCKNHSTFAIISLGSGIDPKTNDLKVGANLLRNDPSEPLEFQVRKKSMGNEVDKNLSEWASDKAVGLRLDKSVDTVIFAIRRQGIPKSELRIPLKAYPPEQR